MKSVLQNSGRGRGKAMSDGFTNIDPLSGRDKPLHGSSPSSYVLNNVVQRSNLVITAWTDTDPGKSQCHNLEPLKGNAKPVLIPKTFKDLLRPSKTLVPKTLPASQPSTVQQVALLILMTVSCCC